MKEVATIGNSSYEFDFTLIKYRKDASSTVIPIKKGSIKHLEIEDNLTNFGYTGSVIFSNYFGILDKLGIGGGINDEVILFDVNIKSLDFKYFNNEEIDEIGIQSVFQLQENTDKNVNPVERNLVYTFDEYSVSLLKQKRAKPITSSTGLITDVIKGFITSSINSNVISTEEFVNNDITIDVSGLTKDEYSVYDVITSLYKYMYYSAERSPGILQLKNFKSPVNSGAISRKFVAKPLYTFFREFTQKLNANNKNLEDYVLEKFTIGGESNEATFRENLIDTYDLLRPDFDELLASKWINYKVSLPSTDDITAVNNKTVLYTDLKTEFEDFALNGFKSNLPDRSDIGEAADELVTRPFANEGLKGLTLQSEASILEGGIKNLAYKSFVFDNTAIVFKTTGSPYRKPGMFIHINSKTANELESSVEGYWFIVGVKHVFANDTYTNDITAVKLFYKSSIRRIVTQQQTPVTETTIPAEIVTDTPQTIDEIDPGVFTETPGDVFTGEAPEGPDPSLFPPADAPIFVPTDEAEAAPNPN